MEVEVTELWWQSGLIYNVLNSMPVYLLSAMSIPKEGMRRLEQTFANLL